MKPGDVYWCTADPGWVTGTSYGIISPLVNGVTSIVDEAEFDAERWYRILEQQAVNIFYTAPTALRMLQKIGTDLSNGFDFSSLRLVASVGEPLDPESVEWAQDVFGVPILDNWWQTETGAIMIANYVGEVVKPGSMGRPLPGITATLLQTDPDGELVLDDSGMPIEVAEVNEVGELAILSGWPSMFRGYLNQQQRYEQCFAGPWYHSGDLGRRDADGYYWFVGRNNDVIKSAGHLIGPFEVESALTEHPAVVEAGVIGKPDPTAGNIVKAFVVLASGFEADDDLRKQLIAHARKRLGAAVAPREIDFAENLPHTRSGKIMRRLLKARELGTDEGDLSTLEVPA
jgi:acetyl-CoA synthetase